MKKNLFSFTVLLYIAGAFAFLAAIAYLGTFTRYMADDYCETYTTKTYSPLGAVLNRYEAGNWRAANRYSNLLFVGVMQSLLGSQNIEIVPVLLIMLWGIGLVYLVRQVRQLAGVEWNILVDIFLGASLAFLSILEAPNRFQTFYWRSSMATHFVPLVFLNFLVAFLFSRMRSNRESPLSMGNVLILLFASFMIGGFSEPPVTVMIVGAGLGLATIWFFVKNKMRRSMLSLTVCVFAGAVSALTVMAVSPAASNLGAGVPSFGEWVQRTMQYTYLFLIDPLKTQPLPILFSIVCPAILVFVIYREKTNSNSLNAQTRRNIALALPFILILLIAAGFSTSAYGQAYPVARARFFAHYLITITLVFEGVLLGIWLAQVKWRFLNGVYSEYMAMILLLVMAIYPFRAGLRVIQEVPEYSARAQAWDRRDAFIYKLHEQGRIDLTVPQLDGVDGVKELDTFQTHWVNQCAARYYQVNSIRAIPFGDDKTLQEYYNNYGN
jgi:hypothetical protein